MAAGKDRRRSERYATASIPVQLSDVNGELIDLSLTGAAATLIFPSYGGIYIPCEVLRSIVQVRRGSGEKAPEYVFRSAIVFNALPPEQEQSFHEFLQIQIKRLEEAQRAAGE